MKIRLKFGAVFAVALFIGMAFVPAVMATEGCVGCEPDCLSCHDEHIVENVDTDCTSCHEDMNPLHTLNVTTIELVGKEKNKAVSDALKNDDVKLLRKALIKDGYKPDIKHATATVSSIEDENGEASEVLTVIIPFKGGDVAIVYTVVDGMADSFGVVHYVEDGKDWYTLYTVSDGVVSKETYDPESVLLCLLCIYCGYNCYGCATWCRTALTAIYRDPNLSWTTVSIIVRCARCAYQCYSCIAPCRACLASLPI